MSVSCRIRSFYFKVLGVAVYLGLRVQDYGLRLRGNMRERDRAG